MSHAKSCTGRHRSSDSQPSNVKEQKKQNLLFLSKGTDASNRHKQIEIVAHLLHIYRPNSYTSWMCVRRMCDHNTINNHQFFGCFAVEWRLIQLDSRETDDSLVCNLGFEIHSRRIWCSIPKWKSMCHILRILVIKKQNKNKSTVDAGLRGFWIVETLEQDFICKLHKVLFFLLARGLAPNKYMQSTRAQCSNSQLHK